MSDVMHCMGWDIGGAHIKFAHISHSGQTSQLEQVVQRACPAWRGVGELHDALLAMAQSLDGVVEGGQHAVTMTGEMSDAFAQRDEGVRQISEMVSDLIGADCMLYAGARGFVSVNDAPRYPAQIASANWHASASFAATQLPQGVLVDMGSTTTDVIAFRNGQSAHRAEIDMDRLASGELVYTGLTRTPLMALGDQFTLGDREYPVMAEWFANTADVHRVLGVLPEHADQYPACDGGTKDVAGSIRRIARMFGADVGADAQLWQSAAQAIAKTQKMKIRDAIQRVLESTTLDDDPPIVGAGVGHFIVREVAEMMGLEFERFDALLHNDSRNPHAIECAPAVSVALLCGQSQSIAA